MERPPGPGCTATATSDLVKEADILLDELSGINDSAVKYLCSEPVINDNWYYELSSHNPASPNQQPEVDFYLLQEIEQKVFSYQVQSAYLEKHQSKGLNQRESGGINDHDASSGSCKETRHFNTANTTTRISREKSIRSQNNQMPTVQYRNTSCVETEPSNQNISTVQLLDARYEMISPPCEELGGSSPHGLDLSQYETISPPIELPQTVSPEQYASLTTDQCVYEYHNRSLPSRDLNPMSWYGKHTYAQNCGYAQGKHYNSHGTMRNFNSPYSHYSYHYGPWISQN